jgi:hypothetical protein
LVFAFVSANAVWRINASNGSFTLNAAATSDGDFTPMSGC